MGNGVTVSKGMAGRKLGRCLDVALATMVVRAGENKAKGLGLYGLGDASRQALGILDIKSNLAGIG
jgi:hypothetical protein